MLKVLKVRVDALVLVLKVHVHEDVVLISGGSRERRDSCLATFAIPPEFRRSPAFSATVVLTLAVGIGVTTAMFSVVNGILLRPLPYSNPSALTTGPSISVDAWSQWRRETAAFDDIALYDFGRAPLLLAGDETGRLRQAAVTSNLLSVLGVRPIIGRDFRPSDSEPGAEPVAILTYYAWQQYFGGRVDVVDTIAPFEPIRRRVIGVLPADFLFPMRFIASVGDVRTLTPLELPGRWQEFYSATPRRPWVCSSKRVDAAGGHARIALSHGQGTASFLEAAVDRIGTLAGVTSVAASEMLPVTPMKRGGSVMAIDPPGTGSADAEPRVISPGYVETMSIDLVLGRPLDRRDSTGASPVAVINETLARRFAKYFHKQQKPYFNTARSSLAEVKDGIRDGFQRGHFPEKIADEMYALHRRADIANLRYLKSLDRPDPPKRDHP